MSSSVQKNNKLKKVDLVFVQSDNFGMNLFEEHKAIAVPQNVKAWDIDPYSKDVLLDPKTFLAPFVKKVRI